MCFPFLIFFGSPVLSVSLAICSILGWKLPFQQQFATFWSSNLSFPWYLQHFGARAVHVAWYFASFKVGLGLVYLAGWFRVGFRGSLIFAGWF